MASVFRFGQDDYWCMRCGKVLSREADAGALGWNMQLIGPIVVGFVCPECSTDEEDIKAQVTSAMGSFHGDPLGLGLMIYDPNDEDGGSYGDN